MSRVAGTPVCYKSAAMFDLFRLWFGTILRIVRTQRSLVLENLVLRQQLVVLKRQHPRPRLGPLDKLFWLGARRFWPHWKEALVIVLPVWFPRQPSTFLAMLPVTIVAPARTLSS
jgi:hypothetical protein